MDDRIGVFPVPIRRPTKSTDTPVDFINSRWKAFDVSKRIKNPMDRRAAHAILADHHKVPGGSPVVPECPQSMRSFDIRFVSRSFVSEAIGTSSSERIFERIATSRTNFEKSRGCVVNANVELFGFVLFYVFWERYTRLSRSH